MAFRKIYFFWFLLLSFLYKLSKNLSRKRVEIKTKQNAAQQKKKRRKKLTHVVSSDLVYFYLFMYICIYMHINAYVYNIYTYIHT